MTKVDYERINGLQCQVNNHQSNINQATSKIAAIDEKLSRLRDAKKSVGNIQSGVADIKFLIQYKKYRPVWKGQNKSKYETDFDSLTSDFTSFQVEMNAYYDAICDEITRLENQKNEQNGFIGWCQSMINSLGNEIEKLFHVKEG